MHNNYKFFLLCFMAALIMGVAVKTWAQPSWTVNPSDYQYTMTLTGIGLFQCLETVDEADMVAAFIGDECRGVQSFSTNVDGKHLAYLTVYDTLSQGNQVTFKLYDASDSIIYEEVFPVIFQENGIMGNPENPHEFKTDFVLTELVLANSTLYDYNKKGTVLTEVLTVNENGDTASYMIDFVDDTLGVDNSFFSIDGNSLVLEEDVDFKNKVSYQIHLMAISDAGCEVEGSFVIQVVNTNVPPTGLDREMVEVKENEPVNTVVTELIALDETPEDEHHFTLVGNAEEWPDNAAFETRQDQLLTRDIFDYEKKDRYLIQIEIEDRVGNTVVDTLEVHILDVIEFDDLKAANLVTPNGDGFNDTFAIPNVELFIGYKLTIFNDLGNEVYSVDRAYDNSWDGLSSSRRELPSGTYYYLLRDNREPANQFTGELHLYRNSKF